MLRRTLLAVAAGAAVTLAFGGQAMAWPDQPVQYVIPFGPGGESDITARYQQPYFKARFGQDLIVSYKPGGGGAVGWSQLNTMKGDGYNIMGMNLPHIILSPRQGKDVGFKTEDITVVYIFQFTPDAIIVKKDSPFKTLKDMVDFAKAHPGEVTLAGSGKGSANHLMQIRFDDMAGIKTTYVATGGTGPAVQAIMGDQVAGGASYSTAAAQYEDNVRMLAIATEKRHPRFPDVPTFKEQGFDITTGAYRGVAVPKSTPEAMRKQVSDGIAAVNQDPEFVKKMEADGFAMVDIPYSEAAAFVAKQTDFFVKLGTAAGFVK